MLLFALLVDIFISKSHIQSAQITRLSQMFHKKNNQTQVNRRPASWQPETADTRQHAMVLVETGSDKVKTRIVEY